MHIEIIFSFFATAVLLAFVPGPDNIFVMTQSTLHGRRTGMTILLGLCTGLVVHTFAVALGIAVLFQKSQLAFTFLKYSGAAYLVYLAWQSFRSQSTPENAYKNSAGANQRKFYLRGIMMNITNPKVSIFFLAFLPQFVDQNADYISLQLITLGFLFILATFMSFTLIVLLSASAGHRFNQSLSAQKIMNKVAGIVFIGLAVKLATTQR